MLLENVLKEYLYDCQLRKLSKRTIKSLRNGELCDIKMSDLCENAIRIYGKGKKIRYVPMTPSINKIMICYLRARENYIMDKYNYHTDYLLLSQKG